MTDSVSIMAEEYSINDKWQHARDRWAKELARKKETPRLKLNFKEKKNNAATNGRRKPQ